MRLLPFRRAAATALIAASLLAIGCEQKREGATRVTVIGQSLQMADPAAGALTAPQEVLLSNVAQGLVRFDARGQIVPGLAERWNVTGDGLSYIFRIADAHWPDGDKVTADQVARILRRQVGRQSENALKDALAAVDEIVAMTDRVVEIRLSAPRPHLLQILAQAELALVRDGQGSGPFHLEREPEDEADAEDNGGRLQLARAVPVADSEETQQEEVALGAAEARAAIALFKAKRTDLVLGGSFADLPHARAAELASDVLRFDPASGLFGLVPAREDGLIADEEMRRLLSQAIDRRALIATLEVPGLLPRSTLLEPGLDGIANPVPPEWAAVPIAERRTALAAEAGRLLGGDEERPILRIALPEGPGADLLLNRLANDWALLGIQVERAGPGIPADLTLVDRVAPSSSPAWFLRQFRCEVVAVCNEEADALIAAARAAPVDAQRAALLAEAARLMDEAQLFIPIAAPIRWSLVSNHVQGFAPNRFARHPLTGLGEQLNPERGE